MSHAGDQQYYDPAALGQFSDPRLARIQNMTTGDAWQEPIDRDESAAEWVGETEARPALDTPALGLLNIPLNEIYTSQVVSQKLLDCSFVDLGAWLESKISDKFSRSEAAAFLSGDGVGKPMGILSYGIVSTADATRPADKLQYVASGQTSTPIPLDRSIGACEPDTEATPVG
jgi:HK97 family phage major capsid protein